MTISKFNLDDGVTTNFEILYYSVLAAGSFLLCCAFLCISVVCFVRRQHTHVDRKMEGPETADATGAGQSDRQIYGQESEYHNQSSSIEMPTDCGGEVQSSPSKSMSGAGAKQAMHMENDDIRSMPMQLQMPHIVDSGRQQVAIGYPLHSIYDHSVLSPLSQLASHAIPECGARNVSNLLLQPAIVDSHSAVSVDSSEPNLDSRHQYLSRLPQSLVDLELQRQQQSQFFAMPVVHIDNRLQNAMNAHAFVGAPLARQSVDTASSTSYPLPPSTVSSVHNTHAIQTTHSHRVTMMIKPSLRHKRTTTAPAPKLPVIDAQATVLPSINDDQLKHRLCAAPICYEQSASTMTSATSTSSAASGSASHSDSESDSDSHSGCDCDKTERDATVMPIVVAVSASLFISSRKRKATNRLCAAPICYEQSASTMTSATSTSSAASGSASDSDSDSDSHSGCDCDETERDHHSHGDCCCSECQSVHFKQKTKSDKQASDEVTCCCSHCGAPAKGAHDSNDSMSSSASCVSVSSSSSDEAASSSCASSSSD
eukprot:CAMPEP_0202726102 /NCGR_PEP_ID=MMETSP1385-20130828/184440_1 /ASSEMBLY_ACC=CAM_ASM_000861 /TAXON_ID=933848 /ORGANISM="Elphidium margaritaceum" /LENGTH=540 /DNA_ID=CAMNT_0049392315 /DNA_START=163 /DNA_END=1786 /DNA_ORIENTATION=+